MSYSEALLQKLNDRTAKIAVIGLGYVGLPLAVEFAEAGYVVLGVDVSAEKVAQLNDGVSYIEDISTEELAAQVNAGRLSATTEYSRLDEADTLIICVPTPLRKTRDPDLSYVAGATEEIAKYLRPGVLLVLESTTYPGTTEDIILPRMLEGGFEVGENVFIAFSPERIDPANKTFGVRNTPKVIGGVTEACTEVACKLYSAAVDTVVPVSSPRTAEMVKLLENTFRAVNIGLINEIAIMCDKLGIDVWEVIDAAKTKPFGFMPFYPGPGLGGHCIPIDPLYLSWRLKSFNYNARFIELADEINTNMPRYVITKISEALNDDAKPIRNSKVLVMGVAYKRDVNDVRESPALDVIGLLQQQGADVCYHDPFVPTIRLEGDSRMNSTDMSDELLASADCVVIVTDHTTSDWQDLLDKSKLVVDTRNAVSGYSGKAKVVKL